jgi:predicted MFS family arabinose efflux permease
VTSGSLLFSFAGLAAIAGSLAGGFFLDAFGHPLAMMTGVFLMNAAVNSTLALCESLPLMATLYFASHFALAVYDVGKSKASLLKSWFQDQTHRIIMIL